MNRLKIVPMGITELAHAYCVSNKTMRNWLKPHSEQIGERIGLLYTPKQIRAIYDCLGLPPEEVADGVS